MLIVMRRKDLAFHRRLLGATALGVDVGHGFGSGLTFTAVQWPIAETKDRFFTWAGGV